MEAKNVLRFDWPYLIENAETFSYFLDNHNHNNGTAGVASGQGQQMFMLNITHVSQLFPYCLAIDIRVDNDDSNNNTDDVQSLFHDHFVADLGFSVQKYHKHKHNH